MKSGRTEQPVNEKVITEIVDQLSQDPLCLEIRHYPALPEQAGSKTLHLLIIMEKELSQAEHRRYLDKLNAITSRYGLRTDVIFSSPKVWQDLRRLVAPFTRIERESTVDWRRQ